MMLLTWRGSEKSSMAIKFPILMVAFLLVSGVALMPAWAREVADNSEAQGVHPMEEFGEEGRHQPPPPVPTEQSPFFRDAIFKAQLRSFYYDTVQKGSPQNLALATGGSVSFNSGYMNDRFAIGAKLYTSQPLYAPSGEGGTNILQANQSGYTVLGQAYLEAKLDQHLTANLGRKGVDTPFINTNDNRMTPNTFEGGVLQGLHDNPETGTRFTYGGGYISKMKNWTSTTFESMSRAAGAEVNRGVVVAGANFKSKEFSLGAVNYYCDDIINIFYTETSYKMRLAHDTTLKLGGQYGNQRSTGSHLLMGESFATHMAGLKADLGVGSALLSLSYNNTGSDAAMQSPWGSYPSYNNVQVQTFSNANESSVMLRAAYDFASHGWEGLSASVLNVHGYGVKAPNYNKNETDVDIKWASSSGVMRGTSLRLRYAHVDWRGSDAPSSLDNIRLIFNYDFPRP